MKNTYKKHIKNRKSKRRSYKSKKNSKKVRKHNKRGRATRKHNKRGRATRKHNKRGRATMHGGFGPGAGPLGFAWVGKDVNTWPGVAGVDGQSNYLPLSKVGVPAGNFQPPENTSQENLVNKFGGGGQQGGGLTDIIPQDLVNFGRSLTGGVQSAIYGYQGVERPYFTDPLPTSQNAMNTNIKYIGNSPTNINQIHLAAGKTVATL